MLRMDVIVVYEDFESGEVKIDVDHLDRPEDEVKQEKYFSSLAQRYLPHHVDSKSGRVTRNNKGRIISISHCIYQV